MEPDILEHSIHGIVARKDLVEAGMTRGQLDSALADGRLTRLGRCLFATASAHPGVTTAVGAGGSLACLSALEVLGVWTLGVGNEHHIRRAERRRRDGAVAGAIECRSLLAPRRTPVDSLDAALLSVLLNHGAEDGIVAIDCILHEKRRTRAELETLLADAPVYARKVLGRASGLVESPLESVVRYRLGQHNISLRCQHEVHGAGRYDFLVGGRLLIELDGFEHHRTRKQFREDRRRDRRATALGYKVLRFTWEDVMHDWPRVLREILAFVRNDYHRRAPRPGQGADGAPNRRADQPAGAPVPSPAILVGGSGRAGDPAESGSGDNKAARPQEGDGPLGVGQQTRVT